MPVQDRTDKIVRQFTHPTMTSEQVWNIITTSTIEDIRAIAEDALSPANKKEKAPECDPDEQPAAASKVSAAANFAQLFQYAPLM